MAKVKCGGEPIEDIIDVFWENLPSRPLLNGELPGQLLETLQDYRTHPAILGEKAINNRVPLKIARFGYVGNTGQNHYMKMVEYGTKLGSNLSLSSPGLRFPCVEKSNHNHREFGSFQSHGSR